MEVEGLAVRWTLDVPDTWFTASAPPAGQGPRVAVHRPRLGARRRPLPGRRYGMAVRGHGYRDILRHYYTGVELGP